MKKSLLITLGIAALLVALLTYVDVDALLDRMVGYFSRELRELDSRGQALEAELQRLPQEPANQKSTRLGFSTPLSAQDTFKWVGLDLGETKEFDTIVLVPYEVAYESWSGPGYGFPKRFRIQISENPEFIPRNDVASLTDQDVANPGAFPWTISVRPPYNRGRYVRVMADKLWSLEDRKGVTILRAFALSELMVLQNGVNIAADLPKSSILGPESVETRADSREFLVDSQSLLGPPVAGVPGTNGWRSVPKKNANAEESLMFDFGRDCEIQQIRLFPVWPDGPARSPVEATERRGYGFPKGIRAELATNPEMKDALEVRSLTMEENPFENPVCLRAPPNLVGRYLRLTFTRFRKPPKEDYLCAMGEVQIFDTEGQNIAPRAVVTPSSSDNNGPWHVDFLTDNQTSQGQIQEWGAWLGALERRKEIESQLAILITQRGQISARLVSRVLRFAIFAVIGVVIGAVLFNLRTHVLRRRALEELRTHIARDMHDEIGSGLGTVSLLSQLAQEGDLDEARRDLAEIHRISVGLAANMRDIVWFNRTDADTVQDLLLKMRETAEIMLAKQNLKFETLGEELNRPMDMGQRRQIFLIFKEAIHNIIKHAQATKVEILVGLEGNQFRLQISDDGVGFDTEKQSSGTGMTSMKHRAGTLKGQLSFETNANGGATLVLVAKIK